MSSTELSAHSFSEASSLESISISKESVPAIGGKNAVKNLIVSKVGEEGYHFISEQINLRDNVFLTFTSSPFNVDQLNYGRYNYIVNLKKINDTRYLNEFFRSANSQLPLGGIYINLSETFETRKQLILNKLPRPLNWLHYFADTIWSRIMPKLKLTKDFYFSATKGKKRVLSRTEILGRLYYCGFEVLQEKYIGGDLFFVARKIKTPLEEKNPYYGTLIGLKRVGKGGKIFKVYKLRTMHAYSEYLQQYVFEKNSLQSGGKFHNDFRISPEGKFFRKFWLDELPMLINFLKGDMKLVGVRPLSQQYYNLYSDELKQKRIQCKPGLIPPFYADMPKTLEEIMNSELKYLEQYQKQPFRTDCRYFVIALKNILFKGARSK